METIAQGEVPSAHCAAQSEVPDAQCVTQAEVPSARCAVMSVAYLPRMADVLPEARGIEVVIPGEAADAVVLCIDREFFRRKIREALTEAAAQLAEPCAHCVAADPLMRGVANALRTELRSRTTPSAVFLESLAGVIAIHLARS